MHKIIVRIRPSSRNMNIVELVKIQRAVLYVEPCLTVANDFWLARHGTARHDTTRHGTARHDTARHDTARHGTAQPYKINFPLGSTESYRSPRAPRPVRHDWIESDFGSIRLCRAEPARYHGTERLNF